MRALSLWQPWASLWVAGPKVHETRAWPTNHRGWLLVHAAQRQPTVAEIKALGPALESGVCLRGMPSGAIVGAVYLEECVPCTPELRAKLGAIDLVCGDFRDGRFAWRRVECVQFSKAVPWRGRQRFFDVPTASLPVAFWTRDGAAIP